MDHQLAQFNMIEQQIRPWDVLDIRVLDAFAHLSRISFVPQAFHSIAYSEIEIPLNHEQQMLSPKMIGRFLQALNLQPQDRVLEIGTGSGYMTALMASLAAQVTSVEQYAQLRDEAAQRLSAQGFTNIHLQTGDGAHAWKDGKRYDAIVLTAAVAHTPQAYLEQLELGGRLVAVIGTVPNMEAILFTRIEHQQWSEERLFETQLPYLSGAQPQVAFAF